MQPKISIIVPAFNEEKRIKRVLSNLINLSSDYEIICINDGSVDHTSQVVKSLAYVKLINLKRNKGKAYAIAKGIEYSKGEILVFLDADISGVTQNTIYKLTQPLLLETCDVVIGCRSNFLEKSLFRPLSGERAYFKKSLLPYLKEFKNKGYGLELYLNFLFSQKKVKCVILNSVKHIFKYKKYSSKIAISQEIKALKEIFREINLYEDPLKFFYYSYLNNFYIRNRNLA